MESKTCRECGKPLGPGRVDRKFCSDSCRTEYNNKSRRGLHFHIDEGGEPVATVSLERAIKHIQAVVLNNREILKQIPAAKSTSVPVEHLEDLGFTFQYCSSARVINDQLHRFCYDYGYNFNSNGTVDIHWDDQELIDLHMS